jgi:hypothetical protein
MHAPPSHEGFWVHVFAWTIVLAFYGLVALVLVKLFAPELHALMVGLGG